GLVQLFAGYASHEDVERLSLVYPLLAARGALYNPAGVDLECGGVELAQIAWDAVDASQAAIEVFEVGHHDFIPETALFQVAHEVIVNHGELARQIGFDVQVAVGGLDARRDANDVGNGGGRRNGDAIGVAHAMLLNMCAQGVPIEGGAVVHFYIAAALVTQHGDGVLRQDATIP